MNCIARLLFSTVLFFLFNSLYGQSNYQQGYIIVKDDTLKGEIDYRNWKKNPHRIAFRRNGQENSWFYSAKDVDRFFVNGEFYTGAVVSVEDSPYRESELNIQSELHFRTDTVFLRDVVSGHKNLYAYEDENGKIHYLIGDRNHIEALIYKQYLALDKGLDPHIRAIRNFIGQLSEYLKDCPAIKDDLRKAVYQRSSLVNIFERYYNCTIHEIEIEKKEEKTLFKFGVVAGMAISRLTNFHATGVMKDPILLAGFSNSDSFCGGASLEIVFPRNRRKWSFYNELLFSKFKFTGEIPATIYYSKERYGYESSILRLNTLVRYKMPWRRVAPFANVGVSVAKTLSEQTNKADIGADTIKPYFTSPSTFAFAFLGGVGMSYKKFSLEGRYEYGTTMDLKNGLAISVIPRFYFLIGYRF